MLPLLICAGMPASASVSIGLGDLVPLAGGALGYVLGKQDNGKTAALGAGLGILLGNYAQKSWADSKERDALASYISGQNYERWLAMKHQWFQYTLDPRQGKPSAFVGLTELDAGMQHLGKSPLLPDDAPITVAAPSSPKPTYIPVTVDSGVYGGTQRTERTIMFPKLP